MFNSQWLLVVMNSHRVILTEWQPSKTSEVDAYDASNIRSSFTDDLVLSSCGIYCLRIRSLCYFFCLASCANQTFSTMFSYWFISYVVYTLLDQSAPLAVFFFFFFFNLNRVILRSPFSGNFNCRALFQTVFGWSRNSCPQSFSATGAALTSRKQNDSGRFLLLWSLRNDNGNATKQWCDWLNERKRMFLMCVSLA